jgi:hypothetical protein
VISLNIGPQIQVSQEKHANPIIMFLLSIESMAQTSILIHKTWYLILIGYLAIMTNNINHDTIDDVIASKSPICLLTVTAVHVA